jgi:hypothetical protein
MGMGKLTGVEEAMRRDKAEHQKMFLDYKLYTDKRIPGTVFLDEELTLDNLNIQEGDLCVVKKMYNGSIAFVKVNHEEDITETIEKQLDFF